MKLLYLLAAVAAIALAVELSIAFTPGGSAISTRKTGGFGYRRNTPKKLCMSNDFNLDPSETGIILIEFQNEFTTEGGKMHGAVKECLDKYGTVKNAQKVMNKAREAGCKIFHVPIMFEQGHNEIANGPYGVLAAIKEGGAFTANEWNSEICDPMKPAEGDIVVKGKSGLCGFYSTNLDFLLRQNGIKNVVIGGFLTNCCVESTMRTAYEHGYKVYTLKDCCAATSISGQEAAYEHTFGLFSVPTTSDEILESMGCSVPKFSYLGNY